MAWQELAPEAHPAAHHAPRGSFPRLNLGWASRPSWASRRGNSAWLRWFGSQYRAGLSGRWLHAAEAGGSASRRAEPRFPAPRWLGRARRPGGPSSQCLWLVGRTSRLGLHRTAVGLDASARCVRCLDRGSPRPDQIEGSVHCTSGHRVGQRHAHLRCASDQSRHRDIRRVERIATHRHITRPTSPR